MLAGLTAVLAEDTISRAISEYTQVPCVRMNITPVQSPAMPEHQYKPVETECWDFNRIERLHLLLHWCDQVLYASQSIHCKKSKSYQVYLSNF